MTVKSISLTSAHRNPKLPNLPSKSDSGSTVNILSKRDFDSLKPKPQLTDTNAKVYPYMSTKLLDLCGKSRTNIVSDHCSSEETFYVTKGSSGSILSWITSQKLNLIRAVSTVE